MSTTVSTSKTATTLFNTPYINKIENRHAMPSMAGFFYICEFFGITPEEFFKIEGDAPQKTRELMREIDRLSPSQTEHILSIIKDITE